MLKEENGRHCFAETEECNEITFVIISKDFSGYKVDCPPDEDDGCEEDQPDPPEIPEPPPEPECGDLKVEEPYEECDCGHDYKQCQDPCCYPAIVSQADMHANSSAKPHSRNENQSV